MAEQTHDLIRDREGAALLGCSRATWWRRVKDGTIPQPIRLAGLTRWPRSEILEVIDRLRGARATPGGR